MRKPFLAVGLLLLIAFACSKSNNQPLNGRWRLVETWINPGGGPDITEPAPADSFYVDFRSDGSFRSNITTYLGFIKYEVSGNKKIRLLRPVTSSAPSESITFDITGDGLKISRTGYIEGCGESYTASRY
ncbi:hypothetical protein [Pseudobacter ginsenosidimutans]|uniref:Lipocalin-like protein n=1 Tax=Pseudobacter ginsenosidimutans TaxID=661488 RepID=A0A4Q7MKK0_9BACT|nr:hypothetical protein [Pseudobacter ginsenosidimutans]RZS67109.1 hypothetical protein EV199_5494 [Pseudobacter ginsenosidimutans]